MIQKWGIKGNSAALISRALDFVSLLLASRTLVVLTLGTAFSLANVRFAYSQSHLHNATSADTKSIIITQLPRLPPPPPFPPANDNFTNSILLSNFVAIGSASTAGATAEPGEPAHDGHPAAKSVWWRWVAPDNGLVRLSTVKKYGYPTWDPYHEAPGIPLYIGIYTGDSVTNVAPVSLLPGTSENVGTDSGEPRTYVFEAISDETYRITGDNPYSCTFFLSLANISLTQPTVLTNLPGDQFVTLEYSPLDTNVTIASLEVFARTNSLGILTNAPFQLDYFPSGPGSVAIWAVGTNNLGATLASFTNTLTFRPLNDDFANATVVTNTGESGSYFGDCQFASAEPAEPDIVPGRPSTHTVWWKWNPLYNVPTKITLFSSSSALAIFKGTNLANLDFVGMVQNPDIYGGLQVPNYAALTFTPEAGATYYVGGEGSPQVAWGFFQQTFELVPAGTVQGFDGDTFDLEALWHESIAPAGPVDFVIGQQDLPAWIGIYPTVIDRLGPFSSAPYRVSWTPTNCGTYILWASFTNGSVIVTNYIGGVTNVVPTTSDTDKTIVQILPRNDFFTNATVIAPDTRTTNFSFNMTGASVEVPEPRHRDGPAVATRWWRWTPSYSGAVEIKAIRQTAAAPLDVYTGDSIGTLRRVSDNSTRVYRAGVSGALRVPVRSGKTYFIRVDDYESPFCAPYGPDFITLTLQPASTKPRGELYLDLIGKTRPQSGTTIPLARVFMPDGQTPVTDASFRAQLYTGSTSTDLAAVGPAMPFYDAGCSYPSSVAGVPWPIAVILPDTKPFTRVFAQVRVWDPSAGATYEAAQAASGLIGESKVLKVITGSEDAGPAPLRGIRSFTLHNP